MSARRVVISGMGTVNPLGHDVQTTWDAMLRGQSGISRNELFDASTFSTTFAAQVKGYDMAAHVPDAQRHAHAGRHCRFALGAAVQAWKQSRLGHLPHDKSRLGVYLGSGEGSIDNDAATSLMIDAWGDGKVDTKKWAQLAFSRHQLYREIEQESNMVVAHLAAEFGATGLAINILTACASSTQALGEAAIRIMDGEADVIISGGAHSMIRPFSVSGFILLTALSSRNEDIAHASRPFDATRDGFVIGEGATIMVLEEYEHAKARNAPMLAEVVGYGASADAFRITDQDPDGAGAAAAMKAALDSAGLSPAEVDYISAHGTGTRQNDLVETRAVKAVFGDHARRVPMSSVKSMVGHLIAAAGATELMTCILAIRDQVLPPTTNLLNPDPNCDLDYVPNQARKECVDVCMSNNFGFGGQNNSIIIRRAR